ncbi:37121_t:CDS:2, partial [Gigaspora margarita]
KWVEIVKTESRRGFESSTSLVVRRMEKHSIQSQDIPEIPEEDMSDIDNNRDSESNCPTDQSTISSEKESHKKPGEDTPKNKLSSKKVKTKDENLSMLKKLIEELKLASSSTNSNTSQAESITSPIESVIQEIIICYFAFGKKLKKRLAEHIKTNKEHRSQRKLYEEVEKQLTSNLLKNTIEKRIERARKIYDLFSSIGENKI